MKRFSPALRSLSLLVAVCFLLQDLSFAAPTELLSRDIAQNPSLLKISTQFAEINEVHRGQKPRLIIHIQDAHSNLSGQENLANVLEELIRRYQLKTIFVEGGDKDNSLDFLRPLAPIEVRRRVAKKYLMKGELNGEEYLSLASDYEMDLWGVEEPELYEKNLRTYAGVVDKRDRVIEHLEEAGKRLQSLKRQLFPKDIVAFDDFLDQFERKEKDFTEYHRLLSETAVRYGVNLAGYPHFASLQDLRAKEDKIDFKAANEEQERLILALFPDEQSRAEAKERLSARLDRIKSEAHTPLSFYETLIDEAGKKGVDMKQFPNLVLYRDYLKSYGRVNMERLIQENRQLEEAVYLRALTEKDAYYLHEISLHLSNLKRLFSLQASKDDFETYGVRRKLARFQPMVFMAFLNSKLYDLGNYGDLVRFQALIDENIVDVEGFYRMTEERDSVFLKNAFRKMDEEKVSTAVLITGGYHTPHLKELLKREGVSYAVLTPNVTQETNLKRYEEILLGQLGEENPLLKKTRLVSGNKEIDDSIRYTWDRQNSPVKLIVADFGKNPAAFPALTSRRPAAARLAGELRLSRAVFTDASLTGNRSAAAYVLEPAEKTRLAVRSWAERDASPFTEEEARVFESERARLTDPAAFALTRAQIRSVKQSFYDRSSGLIRLRLVIEGTDGRKYFVELSGADTTSMERLKRMMPSLADLAAPEAAFLISMTNQGDLPGNFNLTSDGKSWKFFGASDESWAAKSHRVLVESKDGAHAAGTVRLEGRAGTNQIDRIFFTPFGSKAETVLDPAKTEFVLSAYALVWGETPSTDLLREYYVRSSDLRHVFRFPFLDSKIVFYDQLSASDSKLDDAYAARPVDFELRGLDAAALSKALTDNFGYRLVASAADVAQPGDFYVSGDTARLVFLRARYPVNGVAVGADGKIAFVNIEGESGRRGADYWNLAGWLGDVLGWKPAAFFVFDNGKDPSWVEMREKRAVPVFEGRIQSANTVLALIPVEASRLAQSTDDVMRKIGDGVEDMLRHPQLGDISVSAIITYYLPSSQSRNMLPILRPRVEALLLQKGFQRTADPDMYRMPQQTVPAGEQGDERGARLATVEGIMTEVERDITALLKSPQVAEVSLLAMMSYYAPESVTLSGNGREILKERIRSLLIARNFKPSSDPDLFLLPGSALRGARLAIDQASRKVSEIILEQKALGDEELGQAMALGPMALFLYKRTILEAVEKAIAAYAATGNSVDLRRVVLGAYARLQYGEFLEYAASGEAFNAVTDRQVAEMMYGETFRAGDRDHGDVFFRALGELREAVAPGQQDAVEIARAASQQTLAALAAFQSDFSVGAERYVDANRIGFDLEEFTRFTAIVAGFERALLDFFTNASDPEAVRYLNLLGKAVDTFNTEAAPFYAAIARRNELGASTIVQISHALQISWTLAAMAKNRLESGAEGARLAGTVQPSRVPVAAEAAPGLIAAVRKLSAGTVEGPLGRVVAARLAVLTDDELPLYRQIPSSEIPATFGRNFATHGLEVEGVWVSEVLPGGELRQPDAATNPLTNIPTQAGLSVAVLQALAGSAYPGLLPQVLGRRAKQAGLDFGKEIDAAAVKVGRESLEELGKSLGIVIIVGGNEGGFRDESADMPLGLVINASGKNGVYMYFGDSIEVTNGVKRDQGRPGTSSMIALVPLIMPSTDGYRVSLATDLFNPSKPLPSIDPVITPSNTLKDVLGKLADYMDVPDKDAFIRDLASKYIFATLDRPKHDDFEKQAKALGFEVAKREDGDPPFFVRAMMGVPDAAGKKVIGVSTGGANEHLMSLIFATLYGRALMETTYVSTETLKKVDKDEKGTGNGSLKDARVYTAGDRQSFTVVNEEIARDRSVGFAPPRGPESEEELSRIWTPVSDETAALRQGNQAALVVASVTGASRLDWGRLSAHIRPVTWFEAPDRSGRVVVSGHLINNDGKPHFFRVSLRSRDSLKSRYSILSRNNLAPNPLITDYEKTRGAYERMASQGEYDPRIIDAHLRNTVTLLVGEADARDLVPRLNEKVSELADASLILTQLVAVFDAVDRYLLGEPSIRMEDGSVYPVYQSAGARLAAARSVSRELQDLYQIVRKFPEAGPSEHQEAIALLTALYGGSVQYFSRQEGESTYDPNGVWVQQRFDDLRGLLALQDAGSAAQRGRTEGLIRRATARLQELGINPDHFEDLGKNPRYQNPFYHTFLGIPGNDDPEKYGRLEQATVDAGLSLADTDYLRRFDSIFEVPMDTVRGPEGEKVEHFAIRILHNIARGLPAKGGLRWVYARMLTGDKEFMERFNELVAKGYTVAELNFFLRKWVTEETMALSFGMTMKSAVTKLPYGGAKGSMLFAGVYEGPGGKPMIRDHSADPRFRDRMLRNFARTLFLAEKIGPYVDVPAPDAGSRPEDMVLMTDELVKILFNHYNDIYKGKNLTSLRELFGDVAADEISSPLYLEKLTVRLDQLRTDGAPVPAWLKPIADAVSTFTAKTLKLGGSQFREEATGFGLVHVLKELLALQGVTSLKGKTMKTMGYGNVAQGIIDRFTAEGGAVEIVSEGPRGVVYKPGGFTAADIVKLKKMKTDRGGFLVLGQPLDAEYAKYKIEGATLITEQTFLATFTDFYTPAAAENTVTPEDVKLLKTGLIIEGANGAVTTEAERFLTAAGIGVVPDSLANAGGVDASYEEWLQNLANQRWTSAIVGAKVYQRLTEAIREIHAARKPGQTMRRTVDAIALTRVLKARDVKGARLSNRQVGDYSAEVPLEIVLLPFEDRPLSAELLEEESRFRESSLAYAIKFGDEIVGKLRVKLPVEAPTDSLEVRPLEVVVEMTRRAPELAERADPLKAYIERQIEADYLLAVIPGASGPSAGPTPGAGARQYAAFSLRAAATLPGRPITGKAYGREEIFQAAPLTDLSETAVDRLDQALRSRLPEGEYYLVVDGQKNPVGIGKVTTLPAYQIPNIFSRDAQIIKKFRELGISTALPENAFSPSAQDKAPRVTLVEFLPARGFDRPALPAEALATVVPQSTPFVIPGGTGGADSALSILSLSATPASARTPSLYRVDATFETSGARLAAPSFSTPATLPGLEVVSRGESYRAAPLKDLPAPVVAQLNRALRSRLPEGDFYLMTDAKLNPFGLGKVAEMPVERFLQLFARDAEFVRQLRLQVPPVARRLALVEFLPLDTLDQPYLPAQALAAVVPQATPFIVPPAGRVESPLRVISFVPTATPDLFDVNVTLDEPGARLAAPAPVPPAREDFPKIILDLIGTRRDELSRLVQDFRAATPGALRDGIAKQIDQIVNEINVLRNPAGKTESDIEIAGPDFFIDDFVKSADFPRFQKEIEDRVLAGEYIPQLIFAGAATRFLKDIEAVLGRRVDPLPYRFYGLDIYTALRTVQALPDADLLKVLKTPAAVAALKAFVIPENARTLGVGPRQIVAYRQFLTGLAERRGVELDTVLARQRLVLNINEEIADQVLQDFEANNFYGFPRANVVFLVQPVFEGFELTPTGAVNPAPSTAALPFGHGYATTQLYFPGDAFTLGTAGQILPVASSVLDSLIAADPASRTITSAHRVNDLTRIDSNQVVDVPALALGLYLQQEKGYRYITHLVGNPGLQAGGNNLRYRGDTRSFLAETSNTKGSPVLTALIAAAAQQGSPYNAFRNQSTPQALRDLLAIGIRYNLRFKDGYFYLESVTGDLSQIPEANAASIHLRGELIQDFKQLTNLAEALPFLVKQDAELARRPQDAPRPAQAARLAGLTRLDGDEKNGTYRNYEVTAALTLAAVLPQIVSAEGRRIVAVRARSEGEKKDVFIDLTRLASTVEKGTLLTVSFSAPRLAPFLARHDGDEEFGRYRNFTVLEETPLEVVLAAIADFEGRSVTGALARPDGQKKSVSVDTRAPAGNVARSTLLTVSFAPGARLAGAGISRRYLLEVLSLRGPEEPADRSDNLSLLLGLPEYELFNLIGISPRPRPESGPRQILENRILLAANILRDALRQPFTDERVAATAVSIAPFILEAAQAALSLDADLARGLQAAAENPAIFVRVVHKEYANRTFGGEFVVLNRLDGDDRNGTYRNYLVVREAPLQEVLREVVDFEGRGPIGVMSRPEGDRKGQSLPLDENPVVEAATLLTVSFAAGARLPGGPFIRQAVPQGARLAAPLIPAQQPAFLTRLDGDPDTRVYRNYSVESEISVAEALDQIGLFENRRVTGAQAREADQKRGRSLDVRNAQGTLKPGTLLTVSFGGGPVLANLERTRQAILAARVEIGLHTVTGAKTLEGRQALLVPFAREALARGFFTAIDDLNALNELKTTPETRTGVFGFIPGDRAELALEAADRGVEVIFGGQFEAGVITEIRARHPETFVFGELSIEGATPAFLRAEIDRLAAAGAQGILLKPFRKKIGDVFVPQIELDVVGQIAAEYPTLVFALAGGVFEDQVPAVLALPSNVIAAVGFNPVTLEEARRRADAYEQARGARLAAPAPVPPAREDFPQIILDLIGVRRAELQALVTAYQAAEAAQRDVFAKQIDKIVNEINVLQPPAGRTLDDFEVAGPDHFIDDFVAGTEYARYKKEIEDRALAGEYIPQFIFAGAATRFLTDIETVLGRKVDPLPYRFYGLDIYAALRAIQSLPEADLLKVLKTPEAVAAVKGYKIPEGAQPLGVGPRQIIAYRTFLQNLAAQRGQDFAQVMARQRLVFNINEEIADQVLKDFEDNNFYGFDRSKVIFIVQPVFEGFELTPEGVLPAPGSATLPFGHGYATTQLKFPADAFTLSPEGEIVVVEKSTLETLIDNDPDRRQITAAHRVNDLTRIDSSTVVDVDALALGLYLQDKGYRYITHLVGNPGLQAGGNNARFKGDTRSFLVETSNTKGSPALTALIEAAAKKASPYNAFRNQTTPTSLLDLLSIGIRYNLRFKNGRFYLESVTGDLSQIPQANATSIHRRGELIKDFKQLTNLAEALPFLAKQDRELRETKALTARLAVDLVGLTEDQKAFLRQKKVIGIVAAPFAGKGTHLKFVEDELNRDENGEEIKDLEKRFVRIEMGDFFRGAYLVSTGKIGPESPSFAGYQAVAELIRTEFPTDFQLMIAGKLVSSEAAIAVVNLVLTFPLYANAAGILMDGYPRADEQVNAVNEGRLQRAGEPLKIGLYLLFEVPRTTLLRRAEVAAGREGRVDGGKTPVRLDTFETVTAPIMRRLKAESPDVVVVNSDDKPGDLDASVAAVRREELIPAIEAKRVEQALPPAGAEAKKDGARLASPVLTDDRLRDIGANIALNLTQIAPTVKPGSAPVIVHLLFAAPGLALSSPNPTLVAFTFSPTPGGVKIDAKQVPVTEAVPADQAVQLQENVFSLTLARNELERRRVEARAAALVKLPVQDVPVPSLAEPAGFNAQSVLAEIIRGANEALARGLLYWQKGQGSNLWNLLYRNFDQAIADSTPGSIIPMAFPLEAFFNPNSGRIISVDFREMVGMLNAMGRTRRVRFSLSLTYRGETLNPQAAALVQREIERFQRDPRDPVEISVLRLNEGQSLLAAVMNVARAKNNDQVSTLGPVIIGADVKDVKNPETILEQLLLQSLRTQGFNSKVGVFGVAVSEDPDYVVPAASLFAAGIKAISPDMPIPSAFAVFFKEQDVPGLGTIFIVMAIRIDQELRTLLTSIQATQSAA